MAACRVIESGIPDAGPQWGGTLDGAGDPKRGYTLRGARMLTTGLYEWDLFRSIPSLEHPGRACSTKPQPSTRHCRDSHLHPVLDALYHEHIAA